MKVNNNLRTTNFPFFVRFFCFSFSFLHLHRDNILKLKDEFYKPRDLGEDDELENIVDAVLKQKSMAMDTGYVDDVAKYYYRFQNSEQKIVGTDVLALDILRGRDHGLGSYTQYLELCTKLHVSNWTDLQRFISNEVSMPGCTMHIIHCIGIGCLRFEISRW